jgi:hypothetical protein
MNFEAPRYGKCVFEMIAVCHEEDSFQNKGLEPERDSGSNAAKETGRRLFGQQTAIFREYIVI